MAGPRKIYDDLIIKGKITVNGLEISGEYLFPSTDGLANQVLMTDGSGNVTWQTVSVIGANYLPLTGGTLTGDLTLAAGLNIKFPDTTITDVNTLFLESATLGLLSGGNLTDGGGAFVINVSGGLGYYETVSSYKKLVWSSTSITLSPNVDVFIYYNNSGNLVANAVKPDNKNNIILGRVVTNSIGIELIDESPTVSLHTSNLISNTLKDAFGPVYKSGSIVAEDPLNPLKLKVGSGTYYYGENIFNPIGGINITFTSTYAYGAVLQPGQITVDNAQYDLSGSLVALSTGYYAKHSLYVVGDGVNEKYYLVYSQNQYSTLLLAQQSGIPTPPPYFNGSVSLIAGIIVQQGNPNIVQVIDQRPVPGYRAPGVNASADHESLLNLNGGTYGDGGHTNMMVIDGSKAMTGNLNLGTNDILNVSDISLLSINGILIGNFYKGGGNSLGANSVIGLLDNFSLGIQTNGITRINIDSTGVITIPNLYGFGNRIVYADPTGMLFTQLETAYTWLGNNTASNNITSENSAGALTTIDDVNVTATLSGLYQYSLLNNVTLSLGWTGVLSPSRGGTGFNNGSKTIKLGGNFETTGSYDTVLAQQFSGIIFLPNAASTLATTALIETLSNKTLDDTNIIQILDGNLTIKNLSDPTKTVKFDLSEITTTTNRILSIPDADGTIIVRDGLRKVSLDTNDDSDTQAINIITSSGDSYLLEIRAICKKTSGSGIGSVGDTCSYVRTVQCKNVGGFIVFGTKQSTYTFEDILEHNIKITSSTNHIIIEVVGSINNYIHWEVYCDIIKI